MLNFMGVINGTVAIQTNVSCTCNCKRSTSFQSMEITQLEFVQILVIVMVMMVMVVVITCVLNRYRRSARSLLSRHGPQRRPHLPLASEGGLWSSEGAGPSSGQSEQQVFTPRPPERVPSYLQRELGRFQPTYPYLPQSLIDLPPTISLSDGEEPPPYQGPCTLQLRDPEQQLELNRESVRAPPNRTVYDSHLLDSSHCPQAPPHLHPAGGGGSSGGVMATTAAFGGQGARVHGAPPTYSEVIGHYYHPSSMPPHPHQTGGPPHPPSLLQGLLPNISPPPGSTESRNARNSKEKHSPQQV